MTAIQRRTVETNGIKMHLAEQGTGPLVIMCHGFPESWYSWRHQLAALADAGFHAVAPDMRGYGQTDAPAEIDRYTFFHLTGDLVGVLDALGEASAVIVGHDWGASVAWHAALVRPDRFRAVIALSVPFRPRSSAQPTTVMPQTDEAVFYQLYFHEPGVAEAELGRDVRATIRRVLFSLSGDVDGAPSLPAMVRRGGGFLDRTTDPTTLPPWLTAGDVDFYTAEFERTGFRGGLNYYRNADRNWELRAPYAGATVTVPALYVAGDRDLVLAFPGAAETIQNLPKSVPNLRPPIILPGCGHWTQQERPREVNAAMLGFLESLGDR